MVDDVKNLPQNTLDALILLKEDPKAFGGAVVEALKGLPAEYQDKAEKVAKAKFTARTQAEFEAAGKAELELKVEIGGIILGGSGLAKTGLKVSAKAVDDLKKIKLKADFDPNLKVQTNGPSIQASLKVEELKSGSKGDWNKIANNPKPNTIYNFENGYTYKTDINGRVSSVQAELQLGKNDRNTYQQKVSGRNDRASTDHGGHLIASMFKGPGEGINIVPMDKNFNGSGGKWYQLENDWKKALENNQSVNVSIRPVYSGTSKRPDSFIVIQKIGSAKATQVTLKNTASGK